MTIEKFNELTLEQFAISTKVLESKGKLYAHGDRLSNFYKAADLSDCTPERALWGMMVKHIVALSDYITELDDGKLYPEKEWHEKITDVINYLVCLKGILYDRKMDTKDPKNVINERVLSRKECNDLLRQN